MMFKRITHRVQVGSWPLMVSFSVIEEKARLKTAEPTVLIMMERMMAQGESDSTK